MLWKKFRCLLFLISRLQFLEVEDTFCRVPYLVAVGDGKLNENPSNIAGAAGDEQTPRAHLEIFVGVD